MFKRLQMAQSKWGFPWKGTMPASDGAGAGVSSAVSMVCSPTSPNSDMYGSGIYGSFGSMGSEASSEDLDYVLNATASYESAIISEAHGLITDMLADSTLPPHVISGLRAVSNLLKPQDSHNAMHKPKISPLVALTESGQYGSDSEDLPYTGERPTSLPKRLRRSLPPSLIRRMSTSTWTTTTSATGLPTLEPELCRTRSSSFRHSRENTPGSSPANSRSNSPSPSSPTSISLTIPKSRSFSTTACGSAPQQKRSSRERRSLQHQTPDPNLLSPVKPDKGWSPNEAPDRVPSTKDLRSGLSRRLNITSDYESSDSPGSSDHSDNVIGLDELAGRDAVKSELSSRTDTSNQTINKSPGKTEALRSQQLTDPKSTNAASATFPHRTVAHQRSPTAQQPQISLDGHQTKTGTNNYRDSSTNAKQVTSIEPSSSVLDHRDSKPSLSLSSADTEAGHCVVDGDLESHLAEIEQSGEDDGKEIVLPYLPEDIENCQLLNVDLLNQWDYPIFELSNNLDDCILSQVAYRLFNEVGLFDTFRIPMAEFLQYFHALELGYRNKPYHNRVHATDVLHGVYYLTTQPIAGFTQVNPEADYLFHKNISTEPGCEGARSIVINRPNFAAEDSYGIMGGNFPPLELMALYTAAAMHDYDHPGRTNAFLVATNSPLAILYNDRSVLESHHVASAWRLFLSNPRFNWLCHLEKAEFKRFRFLVIEAILATDLKRHFEILAEFNAKVNEEEAVGIDWTNESDRLMVSNMVIKLADINGPCKRKELHVSWTDRITEEFYEQGDEESNLGLPVSPYMDRDHPQLAKLQESFINHLVAPLCNAVGAAGLIPSTWTEEEKDDDESQSELSCKDTEEEEETEDETPPGEGVTKRRRRQGIHCWLTKNLKENHDMWVAVLKKEVAQKERELQQLEEQHLKEGRATSRSVSVTDKEMEPIKEEDTPPSSATSDKDESSSMPSVRTIPPPQESPHLNTSASSSALPPQPFSSSSSQQHPSSLGSSAATIASSTTASSSTVTSSSSSSVVVCSSSTSASSSFSFSPSIQLSQSKDTHSASYTDSQSDTSSSLSHSQSAVAKVPVKANEKSGSSSPQLTPLERKLRLGSAHQTSV